MATRVIRILLLLCIPLALLEAWWLTPDREYYKEMDFAVFYSAGRMFLHGQNPFDRNTAEDVWINAGGDEDVMDVIWGPRDPDHPADHWLPVELIPPGLAVFSFFSVVPVPIAWPLWNVIVGFLFLGQLYATVRLMRRPLWDIASLVMILFTILLEPLHIGLANGQPTVPTISLLILALWWNTINRQGFAGIAFAIATALKPQVAAPFVLLFIYQGKWKTIGVAAGLGLLLTLVAVVQLQVHHPQWLGSWISEVRFAEHPGGIDDARTSNPGRNDLLYLALLGHLLTDNATIVNLLSFTIFTILVASLFVIARHRKESLAMMAGFSMLALLPMYHRFYDAGLVALPVAWALCNLRGRVRIPAILLLLTACAFLIPSDWLNRLFRDPTQATMHAWWFNGLAEPHHVWELLVIFSLLFAGVLKTRFIYESPTVPATSFNRETWRVHGVRIAIACLIPFAISEAWWITPDHDSYKQMDFAVYYTAANMFIHGQNPYDRPHAEDAWTNAGGDYDTMDCVLGANPYDENDPGGHWLPINLIPPALVVVAPLGLLGEPSAWVIWNGIVFFLLIGQAFAVTRLMKKPIWHPMTLVVIVLTILLEPLHIGLANGQPAVPAIALLLIALWLATLDWQITAGIALTIATTLKPQLAGLFVIYFLWQRRWKTVGVAAGLGMLLTVIAIIPMQLHGFHWFHDWLSELRFAELPGGLNDTRKANSGRNDMLNLQILFHLLSDNAAVINILAALVSIGLGAMIFVFTDKRRNSLIALSAFSVLALLPIYHRLYDAGVLMIPIAWAVCNFNSVHRWPARILLLILPAFFLDEQWLSDQFAYSDSHLEIQSRWWFDTLAEPHHVWELLLIFACLAYAAASEKTGIVQIDD
jgi:hypothetical protein